MGYPTIWSAITFLMPIYPSRNVCNVGNTFLDLRLEANKKSLESEPYRVCRLGTTKTKAMIYLGNIFLEFLDGLC